MLLNLIMENITIKVKRWQSNVDDLADYNLQLLMADNCINTTQYDNAEKHLKLASLMCPARFVPLYELMKLYQLKGEEKKTIQIAEIILKKKVKVPSSKVEWIKEKAKNSVKSVIH